MNREGKEVNGRKRLASDGHLGQLEQGWGMGKICQEDSV